MNKATDLVNAAAEFAQSAEASCTITLSDPEFAAFRKALMEKPDDKMVSFRFVSKTGMSVEVRQQSAYE